MSTDLPRFAAVRRDGNLYEVLELGRGYSAGVYQHGPFATFSTHSSENAATIARALNYADTAGILHTGDDL